MPLVEHFFAVTFNVPVMAGFRHKYLKLEILYLLGQPVLVFTPLLSEPFETEVFSEIEVSAQYFPSGS